MKKSILFLSGIVIGLINVSLGAGAGVIAVKLLKKSGFTQKKAQANAIAVIFPITVISLIIYFVNGNVKFYENIFLIPCALAGALIGTCLLKKISDKVLKIIFGLFMIWAGIRILIKL